MRTITRRSRSLGALAAVAALTTGLRPAVPTTVVEAAMGAAATRRRQGQDHDHPGSLRHSGIKEAGTYTEYEKLNPNIKIAENVVERNENYYPALVNHLTTNSGLQDVQAVEVGNIAEVVRPRRASSSTLSKVSGVSKTNWLDWKWQQATTQDGQTIRTRHRHRSDGDLLPQGPLPAGRPAHRPRQGRAAVGGRLNSSSPRARRTRRRPAAPPSWTPPVVCSTRSSAAIRRSSTTPPARSSKTNPAIKSAFDLTAKAASEGLVGAQTQFQPAWDTTIANSKFAAVACPPWMRYLKGKSKPEAAGKWDVATAPKSGNWGSTSWPCPRTASTSRRPRSW